MTTTKSHLRLVTSSSIPSDDDTPQPSGTELLDGDLRERAAHVAQLCAQGKQFARQSKETRIAAGKVLLEARRDIPRCGPRAAVWGAFLKHAGLTQSTAWRLMRAAAKEHPAFSIILHENADAAPAAPTEKRRTAPAKARAALIEALDVFAVESLRVSVTIPPGPAQEAQLIALQVRLEAARNAYVAAWCEQHAVVVREELLTQAAAAAAKGGEPRVGDADGVRVAEGAL